MINTASLLNASKLIIPHLPKRVQKLMPGFLALLPLALEIAKLLYKHREEIRGLIEDLTKQTSKQTKKVSDSIAIAAQRLPQKVGRKLRRWLVYLPFAFEIAKAFYGKNKEKIRALTVSFPSKIKRKIDRSLKRQHRSQCLNFRYGFWSFLRRFQH